MTLFTLPDPPFVFPSPSFSCPSDQIMLLPLPARSSIPLLLLVSLLSRSFSLFLFLFHPSPFLTVFLLFPCMFPSSLFFLPIPPPPLSPLSLRRKKKRRKNKKKKAPNEKKLILSSSLSLSLCYCLHPPSLSSLVSLPSSPSASSLPFPLPVFATRAGSSCLQSGLEHQGEVMLADRLSQVLFCLLPESGFMCLVLY